MHSLLEASQIMNGTLELDRLLTVIVDLVTKNLNAERSTLYLLDEEKGEIWSEVLQGEEWLKIRLPLGTGLAGHVAQTGETVKIEDAYKDSRFYKKIDETTGYITRSMLCMPMRNREGKIIGVFQVLNKKEGWFSHEDEEFLEAMSSHAALAVENAVLYREAMEHRQVEDELARFQKLEAIGRVTAGVAHDFNNLLTLISGYDELLLADLDKNDPHRKQAEAIRKAVDHAITLTRQLLTFSRMQPLQRTDLVFNDVIKDVDNVLERAIGESITLVTDLEPRLKTVKADASQIEQVIMNLAINARDAMPDGGKLTITTANVTLDEDQTLQQPGLEPGPYVMLAVADTGTGMDEETLSHLFEPFFTTKERGQGTGLGLSTIYGIVRQSGGDIMVQSKPGNGATFQVYLPLLEENP